MRSRLRFAAMPRCYDRLTTLTHDPSSALQRLPREQPWKSEVGCGLLAAVVVAGVGGVVAYLDHVHGGSGKNAWVTPVVGWTFLSVGLLMLTAVAYNFLATMNPETVISVSRNPARRGERLTIHLQQPGPIRLRSLRADLFGEAVYLPLLGKEPGKGTTTNRTHLGTFEFFGRDNISVPAGGTFETTATLVIPTEIAPSSSIGYTTTTWRIEVWGSVRAGFNFRHPFVIQII